MNLLRVDLGSGSGNDEEAPSRKDAEAESEGWIVCGKVVLE